MLKDGKIVANRIKEKSCLSKILRIPEKIPFDYLHLVLQGQLKWLLNKLFNDPDSNILISKFGQSKVSEQKSKKSKMGKINLFHILRSFFSENVELIDVCLTKLQFPHNSLRKLRLFSEL